MLQVMSGYNYHNEMYRERNSRSQPAEVHRHRRDQKRKAEILRDLQQPSTSRDADLRERLMGAEPSVMINPTVENFFHAHAQLPLVRNEPVKHIRSINLRRTSSPSHEICFHCVHDHKESCCLYLYDEPEDMPRYSDFKRSIEIPLTVLERDGELPVGNTTCSLNQYPAFTISEPYLAYKEMLKNFRSIPVVYIRKFYWPLPWLKSSYPCELRSYLNPFDIKYHSPNLRENPPFCRIHSDYPIVMKQILEYNFNGSEKLTDQPLVVDRHVFGAYREIPRFRELSPVRYRRDF